MLGMIAVALTWSLSTGQGVGPGIAISIFNLGPLAMGTVFAYTLRPAARTIVELREQATERIAEQAATAASLRNAILNCASWIGSFDRRWTRSLAATRWMPRRGSNAPCSRPNCATACAHRRSSTSRCRPRPDAREPGASRW